MKKAFFAVVVIFLCQAQSFAQSMLKVSLRDGNTPINVSVDGRYFNKRGTSVTVGELPPGTHFLKIYSMSFTRRGRGHEDVIYSGRVNTEQGAITLLVYDPETDGAEINQEDMNSYMQNHPRPTPGNGNRKFQNPTDNGQASAMPAPAQRVKSGTVTDNKMSDLKSAVAGKKSDTEKMTLLKDELKNDQITTAQIADIMDWFSFESTKVDFAKWAYPITVDKDYFSDLENKLTYKNYQDDLDNFLKSAH